VTLQQNAPVLMKHPETLYGWIGSAGISIPEVLLVPLHLRRPPEDGGAGTLWVVGSKPGFFSQEHAGVLTELAAFSSVALRMIQAEEVVQAALQEQEQLTREMAHLYGPAARCKPKVMIWRSWVLRFCIRPLNGRFVFLAIMDIRARSISFASRP
jgi:hypothetical protein